MSIASEPKRCPQCGGPIPAEAPQGLCPKCLLLQASAPTEAGQGAAGRPAPPALAELAAAFPQLEILELIGQGGMGFVFKARQPRLDRFIALKILPQSLASDPAFAERFTREGRVLARLNHPNIVTIHDFGQADGFFYLVMEFVDGVNLRQAMKAGRFTPAQALVIVPKICEALQFAHSEGILHRDIKPENILLDAKGRVKIADFGIAKLVGTDSMSRFGVAPSGGPDRLEPGLQTEATALTETGKILGTPHYMAPEQLEKPAEVDHRADIYSLGVVFYEMLTGELPIGRFAPPSEKSGADPRLDDVVLRTLEKERERRPQSAGEVKTQLETIALTTPAGSRRSDESSAASPETRDPKSRVEPRFSRTAIVGACWIPVFIIAILALYPAAHVAPPPGPGLEAPAPNWRALLSVLPLVLLGITAPFATTLLGWISVSQIRHSAGRLYGMGLAVFDGLLFPLLALDGLIAILFRYLGSGIVLGLGLPHDARLSTLDVLMVVTILAVDWRIVRAVWRAANPPSANSPAPAPLPRLFRGWSVIVVLAIFAAVLAGSWASSRSRDNRTTVMPGQMLARVGAAGNRAILEGNAAAGARITFSAGNAGEGWSCAFPESTPFTATLEKGLQGLNCRVTAAGGRSLLNIGGATQLGNVVLGEGSLVFRSARPPQYGLDGSCEVTVGWWTPKSGPSIPVRAVLTPPPSNPSPEAAAGVLPLGQGTNGLSASAETWSPALGPGEKPDLEKIRQEANALMEQGRHEEALQRHIWYHRHALEFEPSSSAVRLSFLIADWIELGRRFPRARQALVEIRDAKAREFEEGRGYSSLFQDVASINSYLQEDEKTYVLFKSIRQRDAALARQCYFYAESLLAEKGEYALCLEYLGDPQQRFEWSRRAWEMERKMFQPNPWPGGSPPRLDMRREADKRFVGRVCQLIEILVGAGHKADAESIRDQAAPLLDDPELKSALTNAAERIGN